MKRALLLFVALRYVAAENPVPTRIGVEFEVVRMPMNAAIKTIAAFSSSADAAKTLEDVHGMIEGGNAKRVTVLTSVTMSGNLCEMAENEENSYPIEFESEDPRIDPDADAIRKLAEPPVTGFPLTTFETRNCGVRIAYSARPVVGASLLHIRFDAAHVRHLDDLRYEAAVRSTGMKVSVPQPVFRTLAKSGEVLVKPGVPVLLNSGLSREADGMLELHFLTATSRPMAGVPQSPKPQERTDAAINVWDADDAFPSANVFVQTVRFDVAEADALALRPLLDSADGRERALDTLFERARAGGADVIELAAFAVAAGASSGRENIREIRYPIEDIPLSPPQSFWHAQSVRLNLEPVEFTNREGINRLFIPLVPPTNFETRNAGISEDATVSLSDAPGLLDVQFDSRNVIFPGFLRWFAGRDGKGTNGYHYHPDFRSQHNQANVILPSGLLHLLAFNKRIEPQGRIEIAFLRVISKPL